MSSRVKELEKLIRQGESLRLEFKSDIKGLPDRDLTAAVVSLSNAEGARIRSYISSTARIYFIIRDA